MATTSRTLKPSHCRHCRAPTLRGLDHDTCALDISLDPNPITTAGELLALATGRRTYDLTNTNSRPQIEPREPAHVARPRRSPVLAEHHCSAPALPVDVTHQTDPVELPAVPPF